MKWFDMIPPELYGEPVKKPSGTAIGFTGFGADGKLQPSNPTNMVQTMQGPRLLHEGEATMQGPDGKVQVIPQDKLRAIGRGMPGYEEGGAFQPTTPSLPKPESDVQRGIGVFRDVLSGKSPVTESLYNQATSNLGGAQTAAIGAAKQEAAQSGYSKEGIGSVAQTATRNMEGERSKLFGQIATSTQGQMLDAAGRLITAGGTERTYQDTQNVNDWNKSLLYNDPDTLKGQAALKEAWLRTNPGQTSVPDFNVMREERNYAKTQRDQSTQLGAFSVDNARIQNDANRFDVEPGKMLALVAAITNGSVMTADQASAFLGKEPGTIGTDQFNSMRSDRTYTEALRDVSLLSAKTQLEILKGSMDTTKYKELKQNIMDGATLDEIQKIDPKFSAAVYTAISRELAIDQDLREISLTTAKNSVDSTTWNNFVTRVKDSNGLLTPEQLKTQFPGLTITKELIAGVMADKTLGLTQDAFKEALLYNNPNTTEGLKAIQQAWVDAHPGKTLADAPDFEILKSEALSAQQERNDTAIISAGKLAEALIGDAIDTNGESINSSNILTSKTYQMAINNQNLRQAMATKYNMAITDPRINGYIQTMIETAIKGDVPLLVQKFIEEGYMPERYKDTPGWEGALKRSIQDMLNSGAMDKEGNLTGTAAYPWDDPDTFFNYTDWNGKDITYDASGSKPGTYGSTKVSLTGNGTTYFKTVNGVNTPVSFSDMDSTWNTLTESEKSEYFADKDGNPIAFNTKAFMDKYFLNGSGSGIGSGSVMLTPNAIDNYLMDENNQSLATIAGNIMGDPETDSTGFTSDAIYPGTVGDTGTDSNPNAGKSLSTLNAYQYYDDKGILHSDGSTYNGGDSQLNKIWLQFSQMFNGGKIMTAQEFKLKWKEGKGWYVNSDGIVTNFLPEFKTTFGTNGTVSTAIFQDKRGITTPQPTAVNINTIEDYVNNY